MANGAGGFLSIWPLARSSNRQRSISWLLTAMALVIAVPIFLASLISLSGEYFERRNAIESRIADTSAALSLAVDREIASIQFALQVLAQSPALAQGDLEKFYQEAVGVAALYPDANVILADSTGQELIGTFAPYGAKLPVRKADLSWTTIFQDGQPTVSNLFKGAVTRVPAISVDVPVFVGGTVKYDLALSMHAKRFTSLVRELALPPGWVGSLIDRNMTIVARSIDPERFVGERGVRESPEPGTVIREISGIDGARYVGGFTRSSRTGWSTAVLAPVGSAYSGLWRWVAAEVLFLALVVTGGSFAARRVAKRISRSVEALVFPAQAVGQGSPIVVPTLDIIEVDAVGRSLTQAADLLARRGAERAAAEAERQKAYETLETTFRTAPVGVIVVDERGTIIQCNPAAASQMRLAVSAARGLPLEALTTAAPSKERMHELLLQMQAGRSFHGVIVRDVGPDGKAVDLSISGSPMLGRDEVFRGGVLVGQDVTDLLSAEERLRQSARMHAIGQLTGGIAHDFNNLLAIQMLSLDAALRLLDQQTETVELVNNALSAAQKGAELTRRLLAFARRQVLTPRAVRIDDVIGGVSALVRRTLGERITLVIHLDPSAWPIFVDPVQLDTALINLASNARDAMPQGGTLTITARNLRLDAASAGGYGDLAPGDYVVIEVADTGEGMAPDIVKHVFEPFFTTKAPGAGSGLGLSMVFGFVSQSRGTIQVDSTVGKGTTIRLLLPRSAERVATASPAQPLATDAGHGERILVVEDNDALRDTIDRHLESLGYTHQTVANGDQAALLLEQASFDLVLTDIIMPGRLDGMALARLIAQRWPRVKVILTSGYAEAIAGSKMEFLPAGTRVLIKPYRLNELATMIHALLRREVVRVSDHVSA